MHCAVTVAYSRALCVFPCLLYSCERLSDQVRFAKCPRIEGIHYTDTSRTQGSGTFASQREVSKRAHRSGASLTMMGALERNDRPAQERKNENLVWIPRRTFRMG